jgi:tetratricopeptide (TPR) repeat protein/transglutaminase-like putative cysteine protease
MPSRLHLFPCLVALVTACATAPAPPPLAPSSPTPEVDALVAAFWSDAPPPDVRARAEALLQKHPGDARLHEVAGYAALLDADNAAASLHGLAAATDLSGDATELYLYEHNLDAPRAEADAWRGLWRALADKHPRPSVRALATQRLALDAEAQGRFDEAARLTATLGVLGDWMLVGALDNDQGKGFLTEYPPEKKIDLAATVPGPLVPLAWRPAHVTRTGLIPLGELLWPREFAVAYLVTWVHSDVERTAELRFSSSDALRVWCNDVLVLSEESIASAEFDTLRAPVTLHRGWNQVLVKSAQRRGPWWLRVRVSDDKGATLAGLTTSLTPQKYAPGEARPDTKALPPPVLTGPDNRRRFVESRLRAHAGQDRLALEAMQSMLVEAPHNPLARYYGALAYWQNSELGQAIDLLDAGVAATGQAAFLMKRGRYYNQKQLYEKAQADLEAAVAKGAHGRVPRMELSSLYAQRGWQVDRCRVLDGIVAAWPDWAWPLGESAACKAALGYEDEAERLWQRLTRLQPGDASAWERLYVRAGERGDLAQMRRLGERLQAIDPFSVTYRVRLGDIARRGHDVARAEKLYREAQAIAPENPAPDQRLAELAYEHGRKEEALALWKQARERDPNDAALAQRIEFLQPTKLGLLEKYVPDDAAIKRALDAKPKRNPAAHDAMLLDVQASELNADGSARHVVTQVMTAFDEEGRDHLTLQHLPQEGTVKVLRAFSMSERGERQEASSIRGSQVRFRGITVGTRVVLQYVFYQSPPQYLPGAFIASWYFSGLNRQALSSRWVLLVPHGKKLAVHVVGGGWVREETAHDGDYVVRTFAADDVAPVVQESNMPSAVDLIPSVEVSTLEGWDDYVRWERALLVDVFHSNAQLDALVDKLTKDVKSPREQLDKLFHYAAQEVRYQQDYETTIAGVRPHAAPSVIERGYGDCKDKAVLLIQMAQRLGLRLRLALVRTMHVGHLRKDVPSQQFNHAIVYVPAQADIEQPYFMDPTVDGLDIGNLRSDDQGTTSLVIDPTSGSYQFIDIPYQAPEMQFDRHKIHIAVKSPTEVIANDEVTFRGMAAMALRRLMRSESTAKKVYEAISSALFPGTTLREAQSEGPGKDGDIWNPLSLMLDVDVSSAVQAEDSDWRLKLPATIELTHGTELKKRETPLFFGPPYSSRFDIEADLPDGFQVVHAPKDVTVEHACFSFARKTKIEGRRVTLSIDYRRRCSEVAVADYEPFRAAAQKAAQSLTEDLAFARLPTPTPKRR